MFGFYINKCKKCLKQISMNSRSLRSDTNFLHRNLYLSNTEFNFLYYFQYLISVDAIYITQINNYEMLISICYIYIYTLNLKYQQV